jgi:hypothetical protein
LSLSGNWTSTSLIHGISQVSFYKSLLNYLFLLCADQQRAVKLIYSMKKLLLKQISSFCMVDMKYACCIFGILYFGRYFISTRLRENSDDFACIFCYSFFEVVLTT